MFLINQFINKFSIFLDCQKTEGSEEKTEGDLRWRAGTGHGWSHKRVVFVVDKANLST